VNTEQDPVEWAKKQLLPSDIRDTSSAEICNEIEANIERVFSGSEWRYSIGADGVCHRGSKAPAETHRRLCLAAESLMTRDLLVERLHGLARVMSDRQSISVDDAVRVIRDAAYRIERDAKK
jgi:hypothetical protein